MRNAIRDRLALGAAVAAMALVGTGCAPEWTEFVSEEGGFSVRFPGQPTEQTQTVRTASGPVAVRIYSVEDGRFTYMASFTDYPIEIVANSDAQRILDGARDGAAINLQGTVVSESASESDGVAQRTIRVVDAGGQLTHNMKLMFAGRRLYQVDVLTPREDADHEDVQAVLDSLVLLDR